MDFSDTYLNDQNVLLIRKDDVGKYTKLEDFYGKPIAVQKSTQQEALAKEHIKDGQIVSLDHVGDALMELQHGKVEAVPAQRVVAQQYLIMNPALADSGVIFEGADSASAVAVPKGNDDLMKLINEVIQENKQAGNFPWRTRRNNIRSAGKEPSGSFFADFFGYGTMKSTEGGEGFEPDGVSFLDGTFQRGLVPGGGAGAAAVFHRAVRAVLSGRGDAHIREYDGGLRHSACLRLALRPGCSSYETLFAAVMMSGLGSSLYHPEGALMVNRIAGAVRGRAMGTFSVGGNAGFAVGPALAGLCAYGLGIEWLFLFAAVNAALAAALFFCMPKAEAAAAETSRAEAKKRRGALRNRWGAFGKLSVTILARSVAFTTCNTFIPLYWIHVLGADEAAGSNALAILFTAGACITYGGGLLADRFSMRGIIRAAFFVMIPAMYFLTNSENITAATLLLLPGKHHGGDAAPASRGGGRLHALQPHRRAGADVPREKRGLCLGGDTGAHHDPRRHDRARHRLGRRPVGPRRGASGALGGRAYRIPRGDEPPEGRGGIKGRALWEAPGGIPLCPHGAGA